MTDWGGQRAPLGRNVLRVGLVLVLAFVVLAGGDGYWQVMQAQPLSAAPDNPAIIAAARQVVRGRILDRDGKVLASNAIDAAGQTYRVYADPSLSGVLGYASLLYGTAGLERAFDAQLTGIRSADPVADMLRKFQASPYDPSDLTLSLSLPLQERATALLGKDRGAVVMLDPSTGHILAMASTPTFDASAIADPATAKAAWAALQADPGKPLLDRAVQGLYVPGSVFKIVTALAALGSGAIAPSTTFPQQPAAETNGLIVSGYKVVDGHHPFTDGEALDFVHAVEVSCNIYFALTGLKLGGAGLSAEAEQLGFGAPIPFDLPTAASQITNGGGNIGGGFKDDVELANAAYGQAEVLVTPLQMALVAAAVANGGQLMRPELVTGLTDRSGTVHRIDPQSWRDVVAPDVADTVKAAMEQAVESEWGSYFTPGAKVPGIPTAGKTGTAQLGGSGEPNSWFIGFAPVDQPKVAIAVVVEHGGGGGARAAPMAGQLMTYYLKELAQ
ncbi:MAG TPA: penicillin-binding transpeptidase domain-containing protein [Candidatus Limnocylindrales bacterium]